MRIEELTNAPQWLKDAKTESADVLLDQFGRVIWCDGVWCGGVWCGGEWRDGEWRGGEWCGGEWRGGEWRGGVMKIGGKKVQQFRCYVGLYAYGVHAVLFADGSRWIRMGCLWKSLEEWEKIGIRNSNLHEYPNDGSEKCEERVAAFEFARAAVLRMKLPEAK